MRKEPVARVTSTQENIEGVNNGLILTTSRADRVGAPCSPLAYTRRHAASPDTDPCIQLKIGYHDGMIHGWKIMWKC
jgi:hypothetical protein